MSSHAITVGLYLLFLAIGIGLSIRARNPKSQVPSFSQMLRRLMHGRTGRIALVAWWAFIGLHLFSK